MTRKTAAFTPPEALPRAPSETDRFAMAFITLPAALAPAPAATQGNAEQQKLMDDYAAAAKQLADVQAAIAAHNASVANQPPPTQSAATPATPMHFGTTAEPEDKQLLRLVAESVDLQKQILAALKQGEPAQATTFDPHRLCFYESRPYSEGAVITLPSGIVQTCRRLGRVEVTNREAVPLGWETLSVSR